jgi:5-methylcytosine-specific restriction endonuclease McrA
VTDPACNTREPTRSAWQRYMRSPAWVALRAKAFERDGHRCVLCNRDDSLQGHHRRYPARPELDEVGNVYTLCSRCHLFLAEERSREERYRRHRQVRS